MTINSIVFIKDEVQFRCHYRFGIIESIRPIGIFRYKIKLFDRDDGHAYSFSEDELILISPTSNLKLFELMRTK